MAASAERNVLVGRLREPPAPAVQLGIAGAVVCVAATAVASSAAPANAAVGLGLQELLIVAVPIGAGVYALHLDMSRGLAMALVVVGFSWSLTALAESSSSVPYTIGRLATWLVFPGIAYLLLTFPEGHIESGLDRALFAFLVVACLLLFFATAPLVVSFPAHTPWATCITDCPANAIAVVSRTPAWFSKAILVREWMVEVFWVGLWISMLRRWRAASPLRRRAMAPAFVSAVALGLCHIAFITARQLGAPAATVEALGSAWTLCIVVTCGTIFLAMLWRRTLLADAMRRLGGALKASDATLAVRNALAEALGDPKLQVMVRDSRSGKWHDPSGHDADAPPTSTARRTVTAIGGNDAQPQVALVHDAALRDDEELLEDATDLVLASLRHDQLVSSLVTALGDLEASRQRMAEAALLERARIERDLHDGAQQQLIALRIRADIAEELLKTDPAATIEEIRKLAYHADRALAELRSCARGIYPALLTDRGLTEALRSIGREAPIPVHVSARGVKRHPIEIESAVYFTCVEAIQNAAKHAERATGVWLTLTESCGALHFTVKDDGYGFDLNAAGGHGLRNMRDRIEAEGGHLRIETSPGRGTRVIGDLDVAHRLAHRA